MSKSSSSFLSLRKAFSAGKLPENMLLEAADRIISDDLVDAAFIGFVGKGESKEDSLSAFTADDLKIDSLMNECMGGGLFSTRKVVVIRNPKKLTKPKKLAITEYLASPNPDVCLIIITDENEGADKLVFSDSIDPDKLRSAKSSLNEISVTDLSEEEMTDWIREKFDGFEISEESITHLLSLSNFSLAEILPEIDKLKTFCHFKKNVTVEDINLCNGIAKDFSEGDFIKAVMKKDIASAVKIYTKISLKKDIEVYLVFLLNTAFCALKKLEDPASSKLQGFNLKKELKLWGPVQEVLLPLYKKVSENMSPSAIDNAFGMIYLADKKFKSSSSEKSVTMTNLIHGLCSLQ